MLYRCSEDYTLSSKGKSPNAEPFLFSTPSSHSSIRQHLWIFVILYDSNFIYFFFSVPSNGISAASVFYNSSNMYLVIGF